MNDPSDSPQGPLTFYGCYLPGKGRERYYLSNGKEGKEKGLRLFKSHAAAETWLKEQLAAGKLSREFFNKIVIEPIEGKIALPEETAAAAQTLPRVPLMPIHLNPIITLEKPTVPSVGELVEDYLVRQKKRRRRL